MKLTSSQYKTLKPQEQYLKTAFYSQYVRTPLLSQRQIAFDMYSELTGKKVGNVSCGSCLMDVYSFLGRLYFEYQETLSDAKKTVSRKGKSGKSISKKKTVNDENQ